MKKDIISLIRENVIQGRITKDDEGLDEELSGQPGVSELIDQALAEGIGLEEMIAKGLSEGMEIVGER